MAARCGGEIGAASAIPRLLKRSAPIPALASLLLLSACNPQIEADIKASDILGVRQSGEPAIAQARVLIPQSSLEDCAGNLPVFHDGLAGFTKIVGSGTCEGAGDDVTATFVIEMPILAAGSTGDSQLLYLTAGPATDDDVAGTEISAGMTHSDSEVLGAMNAAAGEPDSSTDLDPPVFTFNLENDSGSALMLTPLGIFVDGDAGLPSDGWPRQISHGQTMVLKFSDVLSDHIGNGNLYPFAILSPAPPQ